MPSSQIRLTRRELIIETNKAMRKLPNKKVGFLYESLIAVRIVTPPTELTVASAVDSITSVGAAIPKMATLVLIIYFQVKHRSV
jgi:hypothetical protein